MACDIAFSRSYCQLALVASAPEVDAWEKEEELAATRRGVNAFWNVPIGDGDTSLWEMLRDVHFLMDSPGADHAAKAYMLLEDITKHCPESVQTSVKVVAQEVCDIIVLRCLCQMERKDHGNTNDFVMTVANAFGQALSNEYKDNILLSHQKFTCGRRARDANPTGGCEQTPRRRRYVVLKANQQAKPAFLSPDPKRPRSEAFASKGGAAQPAVSDCSALAWVTKAIRTELSRLQPFRFRRSEENADPRTVSHTGTWTYFLNKLERSVVAYTRQELDEANVERSRRSSVCDDVKTIKTTANALKCKLQVRSPESIEEFCSLAEQFVEN